GRLPFQPTHDEHRTGSDENWNSSRQKDAGSMPVEGQHQSADQRPEDRPQSPDSKRPTDAARANEGGIIHSCQRIRADLRAHNAKTRGEHDRNDESDDRATLTNRGNEQSGEKIAGHQHAVWTEAVNEPLQ